MKYRFPGILLVILLLSACATGPQPDHCANVGASGVICLLPPAALPAVKATHMVTLKHQGITRTFVGQLQIDNLDVHLAGSNLMGLPLFQLNYDGRHITSEPANQHAPARMMVAILEMMLVDPERLRPRLRGLVLKVHQHENHEVRDLYEQGKRVMHMEKTTGSFPGAQVYVKIQPLAMTLKLVPLGDAP